VKLYGTPKIVMTVPRTSFAPAPEVDSAVLSIADITLSGLTKQSEARFFELVHAGFSQKRKQVVPLLTPLLGKEKVLGTLAKHLLPSTVRAEDMPLSVWLDLVR
jgi:16S rRNA (adenine1518-N6/adenine1519-N6)-dimethyltransferase